MAAGGDDGGRTAVLIDASRRGAALKWKTDERTWKQHLVAVVVAAAVGLLLVTWRFGAALEKGGVYWVAAGLGVVLLGYVFARSLVAVFGKVPGFSPSMRNRWRIGWSVGALTIATIAGTSVTFAVDDEVRQSDPFCTSSQPRPEEGTTAPTTTAPATTTTTRPAGSPSSAPVDTTTSVEATTAVPPSTEGEAVPTEAFGFERGVRSHTFIVKAPSAADADALGTADFTVIADDGRAVTNFARVRSVTSLTAGEASVRLEVDLSCHSGIEGGRFEVSMIYRGDLELDRSRWDLAVTLQSRLVFYALALVPSLVILAMYQVFAVWPMSLKRWFTNVLAIGAPVLAAFTAAGINDPTWSPSLVAVGALIAATYTAAVAAATLVKNGGHDLGDGSDVAHARTGGDDDAD